MKHLTVQITDNIIEIIRKIDAQLSLDYISLTISFGKKKFYFNPPTTLADREQSRADRRKLIKLILDDAWRETLSIALLDHFTGVGTDVSDLYDKSWARVLQFETSAVAKEDIISPISAQEYEVNKVEAIERSKALNWDSYSGVMERSDLTEEERDWILEAHVKKGEKKDADS